MLELSLQQASYINDYFLNTYDSCCNSFKDGVMGRCFLYHSDLSEPFLLVAIVVGDFCYIESHEADISALDIPAFLHQIAVELKKTHFHIVSFSSALDSFLLSFNKVTSKCRYAMNKDPNLNYDVLLSYAQSIPKEYVLTPITETLFHQVRKATWSEDFSINYPDYKTWKESGIGYLILKDSEIIAGASSYSSAHNTIEITIATKTPYRRKGLATKVCAALLLDCMNKKINPSWDAANCYSVATAKNLGYSYLNSYTSWIYTD